VGDEGEQANREIGVPSGKTRLAIVSILRMASANHEGVASARNVYLAERLI
jgi:hypothetical protein